MKTKTDRELLKLALEALKYRGGSTWLKHGVAVEAIEEALAQPAQEPVAHVIVAGDLVSVTTGSAGLKSLFDLGHGAPLYATPQQRPWVGLTDEDMGFLFPHGKSAWVQETVTIVEAKLKEKNT
jgi:hypothetical protein